MDLPKKVPLGVRLKSTRPSESQETLLGKFPWGEIQNGDLGCRRADADTKVVG